jgi:hypothetical protein
MSQSTHQYDFPAIDIRLNTLSTGINASQLYGMFIFLESMYWQYIKKIITTKYSIHNPEKSISVSPESKIAEIVTAFVMTISDQLAVSRGSIDEK